MILDKKYKCPVCLEECITVKDRLQITIKMKINCNNCNACLSFAPLSYIITIPISLFCIAILFLASDKIIFNYIFISYVILSAYFLFFCGLKHSPELETSKINKPAFNLNKFLDNLKNSNCEKWEFGMGPCRAQLMCLL